MHEPHAQPKFELRAAVGRERMGKPAEGEEPGSVGAPHVVAMATGEENGPDELLLHDRDRNVRSVVACAELGFRHSGKALVAETIVLGHVVAEARADGRAAVVVGMCAR